MKMKLHTMPKSKNDKNEFTWTLPFSRTENGEQIVKKGSVPLNEIKLSRQYEERCQKKDDWVKRKYAVCFAYCGSNYQGLQMNPNCKSVEAEMERALFLAGGFTEDNYGFLQKLQWTRAARTDRGVHAMGQCCSMRLYVPSIPSEKDEMIAKINKFLPYDIQCMAITRVVKTFNAHIACQSRKYSYLLPTYLFTDIRIMNEWLQKAFENQGPILDCARIGGFVEPGSTRYLGYEALQSIRQQCVPYRVNAEKLELFRKCLKYFEGTHHYHNFTTGKDSKDDSSKRYITSCVSSDPFLLTKHGVVIQPSISTTTTAAASNIDINNTDHNKTTVDVPIEWICVTLVGQSFVLNQIRKMVGMAVDVTRGSAGFDTLVTALSPGVRAMEVAMAPPLGLYLQQLFFDHYNLKQKQTFDKIQRDLKLSQMKSKQRLKQQGRIKSVSDIRASALAAVQKALQDAANTTTAIIISNSNTNTNDSNSSSSGSLELNTDCSSGSKRQLSELVTDTDSTTAAGESHHSKQLRVDIAVTSSSSSSAVHVTSVNLCSTDCAPVQSISSINYPSKTNFITTKKKKEEEEVDKDDGSDDEAEGGQWAGGEPILWWTDEAVRTKIENFRTNILWPHIVEQELKSLCFLFYFDSLRFRKYLYLDSRSKAQRRSAKKAADRSAAAATCSSADDDDKNNKYEEEDDDDDDHTPVELDQGEGENDDNDNDENEDEHDC